MNQTATSVVSKAVGRKRGVTSYGALQAFSCGKFIHLVENPVSANSAGVTLKQTLTGHPETVRAVSFSPNGATLASGTADHKVIFWDATSGQKKQTLSGFDNAVCAFAFSPDGATIASGCWDNSVVLWDAVSGQKKQTLSDHTASVYSVTFSPDGATLASSGEDHKVILWDTTSGQKKQTLTGHTSTVHWTTFSPDDATVASGSGDNTVILWDAVTGQRKQTLAGHTGSVYSIAFSPDGAIVASGSGDKTVILWDAVSGERKQTLAGHAGKVYCIAFSPDGGTIVSGNTDHTMIVWDATSGQQKQRLTGHTNTVHSVAFSPDGTTLASGSWDRTVILWDAAPVQKKLVLGGHTSTVRSFDFSPNGATIASSDENKVLLWDAASGRLLSDHGPFLSGVDWVTFDEKGSLLRYDRDQAAHLVQDESAITLQRLMAKDKEIAELNEKLRAKDFELAAKDKELQVQAAELADMKRMIEAPNIPSTIESFVLGLLERRVPQVEETVIFLSRFCTSEPDQLQFRDVLRSINVEVWNGVQELVRYMPPKSDQRSERMKNRIGSLDAAMNLQEHVVEQYPLRRPDSQLWPWEQARDRIRKVKQEWVTPLLETKLECRQTRERIQTKQRLGVEIDTKAIDNVNALQKEVSRLVTAFKPAYEQLMLGLRPGFPELRSMIGEDIDRYCGMGNLRLDVMLSDFRLEALDFTPNVSKASTVEAAQERLGLKPKYIFKKFTDRQSADFFREMEAMRVAESNGVHHPNVGEVDFGFVEVFGDDTTYFLAMPQYQCDSRKWFKLQLESNNASAVIRALFEMADGLNCLHHNGVIHGDIKPDNVMFDVELPTGRPKWIDFNFSGVESKTNVLLKPKTAALGFSRGFTPPEFDYGSTDRRTVASDVYSLGMTIAVLLGLPDPSGGEATLTLKESTPLISTGTLGSVTCDEISKLCRLMANPEPEKRVPLKAIEGYGVSVLERLHEISLQVDTETLLSKSKTP